jgi:hypothetical protein
MNEDERKSSTLADFPEILPISPTLPLLKFQFVDDILKFHLKFMQPLKATTKKVFQIVER